MSSDDRLKDSKFVEWSLACKKKFDFTCEICKVRGSRLASHHLQSWDAFPEERYDLDNSSCLCIKCHESFHQIYGFGRNTRAQFEEYKQFLQKIKKVAQQLHDNKLDGKISQQACSQDPDHSGDSE